MIAKAHIGIHVRFSTERSHNNRTRHEKWGAKPETMGRVKKPNNNLKKRGGGSGGPNRGESGLV